MRAVLLLTLYGLTLSCGYVGDPLPPTLDIPMPVIDLRAVQEGQLIRIGFTIPAVTTEQMTIKALNDVDLRIGPATNPFVIDQWAEQAERVTVEERSPGPARAEAETKRWVGREVAIAVRLTGVKGRSSDWSAPVRLRVVVPLGKPFDLRAQATASGVKLTWQMAGETAGLKYRIFRSTDLTKPPAEAAIAETTTALDPGAGFGTKYSYRVQAFREQAESPLSDEQEITPVDVFAPVTPSGVSAIGGLNTIEITWDRNTEPDLQGYRVYRAEGSGDFIRVADALQAPAFSDKTVASGLPYRYRVTAFDTSMNESTRSAQAEITAP